MSSEAARTILTASCLPLECMRVSVEAERRNSELLLLGKFCQVRTSHYMTDRVGAEQTLYHESNEQLRVCCTVVLLPRTNRENTSPETILPAGSRLIVASFGNLLEQN